MINVILSIQRNCLHNVVESNFQLMQLFLNAAYPTKIAHCIVLFTEANYIIFKVNCSQNYTVDTIQHDVVAYLANSFNYLLSFKRNLCFNLRQSILFYFFAVAFRSNFAFIILSISLLVFLSVYFTFFILS